MKRTDVIIVTGAGQISMAIARRIGYGKKIIIGDIKYENAEKIYAEKIEKEVNDAILETIKKDNSLNFSATSINLFTRCPYAFALIVAAMLGIGLDKLNAYSVEDYTNQTDMQKYDFITVIKPLIEHIAYDFINSELISL